MMVSFNCQLDTIQNYMVGESHEGLSMLGWPVILSLLLMDLGRPSLKADSTVLWFGAVNCMKVEKASWSLSRQAFLFLCSCLCT